MTSTPAAPPARPTPPWLFLFLDLPFGAAVGYAMIAMPFWLRQGGVPLDRVGAISAAVFAPHAFKILWIPVLDIGSLKRAWYLAMTTATAALLVAASLVPDPLRNLGLYTTLIMLAQATATTGHAANNALMAITTRFEDKGKAGGFSMASNVGGTGLLGALALWVSEHVSPRAGGIVLALVVVASASLALRIVEPRRVDAAVARAGSVARALGLHLWEMTKDLGRTVRSRAGFTGLVICLVPVGCGALTNLFAGMAPDFGASARVVELVNGLGGGITSAAGSLVGGYLADRMSRRLAYAVAGGITALSALAMLLAPLTPATYAWGTLAYSFANGIAFATWAGMVLELIGHTAATTTKYALFNSASNLAISYVTWLDGWAASAPLFPASLRGSHGSLAMDVVLTFTGIAVLLVMVAVVRRRGAPATVPEPGTPT
ncbi:MULTISPECIES: MFS transporter [Anaeromyxobacter]|uniref:MFS transporter n=1 Tax=Anaeromyxobacter TaxID=161492 RepID=UPI001F5AABD8|nr:MULTISPECIES: MFS transporter [unclassified Anaeromyxobacter]